MTIGGAGSPLVLLRTILRHDGRTLADERLPKASRFDGCTPRVAIFHRFDALNTLNLLYFQAELTTLDKELARIAKADAESNDGNRKFFDCHWEALAQPLYFVDRDFGQAGGMPEEDMHQPGHPHEEISEQWAIALKIRKTLKEYSRLII